ncbi:MAG: glycosyltransferase family 2 protein [Candidatus Levybacteria bacterium]|nr:glycosyltransferase family 2 protein [Candidatus Levybacteria bacterium]
MDSTKACIHSLCGMTAVKNVEVDVFIVDNKSPEPFPEGKVRCDLGEVYVVRNKGNFGYSGGMNSGMTQALARDADYIAVVNNDTVFDKKFLHAVVEAIRIEKKPGIFVPKIYFYPGTEYHHDRYKEKEWGKVLWYAGGNIDWKNVLASHRGVDEVDAGQYDGEDKTLFATGCCIILPKVILEEIGMFDDRYYLYFEDIDLSMRVKNAGFFVYFVPKAVLWHKNAQSAGGPGSNLQEYFITRNRLLFGFTYAPIRSRLALIRESISVLLHGRKWQKKGVIDFYLSRLNKGTFPLMS